MALFSFVIAWIPFVDYRGGVFRKAVSYGISSLFFLSLIVEFFFLFRASRIRKKIRKRNGMTDRPSKTVGLFRFFSNRYSVIVDAGMILLLIAAVLVNLLCPFRYYLVSAVTAGFVFAVQLHSVLNGRIYQDLSSWKKGSLLNE